jgi:hypothetical protein
MFPNQSHTFMETSIWKLIYVKSFFICSYFSNNNVGAESSPDTN